MKMKPVLIGMLVLGLASGAAALDLDGAKQRGLVGEQADGYLGVVNATPEVVELVSEVNARRRDAYQRIARQNGITLDQVAALAGEKAIDKTPAGGMVQDASGKWVKK
ncbi:YdbL family protein [Isoalcanivorax beigongshangi]|uniref:YdbL family protein n=1 Tax=Isoalcanivorax beigongshangi TaxID=3238810 RepID=A0ABV4AIT2_9GAMM